MDEKGKVRQILLQTSLDLVQLYHLRDICSFPQRHCPSVLLETAFLSAEKARKVRLQTVMLHLPATHQESMTSKLVSELNRPTAWTGGKCMTGLSQRCDVIPKFSPAWDPPHSHCAKSTPCGPWEHPWPLPCRWLTGSPQTAFPNLTPTSPPPPRRFLEKTSLFQFYKQKTHLIWSSNWTSLEANGRGTGRGRNNRLVYRWAGCVNSSSLACFL